MAILNLFFMAWSSVIVIHSNFTSILKTAIWFGHFKPQAHFKLCCDGWYASYVWEWRVWRRAGRTWVLIIYLDPLTPSASVSPCARCLTCSLHCAEDKSGREFRCVSAALPLTFHPRVPQSRETTAAITAAELETHMLWQTVYKRWVMLDWIHPEAACLTIKSRMSCIFFPDIWNLPAPRQDNSKWPQNGP